MEDSRKEAVPKCDTEYYKDRLAKMAERLSLDSLKRVYELACFLYVHYGKVGAE